MSRPICFMITPYSAKLWETALRPAIDKAGYEPVRGNEHTGAHLHEMIERLATSGLVLARRLRFPTVMSTTRWHSAMVPKKQGWL